MHDYPAIMRAILDGYALSMWGYHGVVHCESKLPLSPPRSLRT
jgi:hypothetical protein